MSYGRGGSRGRGRGQLQMLMRDHRDHMQQVFEPQSNGLHTTNSLLHKNPETGNYTVHVKSIPNNWTKKVLNMILKNNGLHPTLIQEFTYPPNCPYAYTFVEFHSVSDVFKAYEISGDVDGVEFVPYKRKAENETKFEYVPNHLNTGRPKPTTSLAKLTMDVNSMNCVKTITANKEEIYSFVHNLEPFSINGLSLEDVNQIEDCLYKSVTKMESEVDKGAGKCQWCEAKSHLGCSVCGESYCSEDCFSKNWSLHSKNCRPSRPFESDNGNRFQQNQSSERGNQFGGSRNNTYENNFAVKQQHKSSDRGNQFGENQNSFDNNFTNKQSNKGNNFGQHMFEERKSRFQCQNQNFEKETNQKQNKREEDGFNEELVNNVKKSSDDLKLGKEFIQNERDFLNNTTAAQPILPANDFSKKMTAAHPFLPANEFSKVRVVNRSVSASVAVVLVSKRQELQNLVAEVQADAVSAPLLTPQPSYKCIIKWAETNLWYRGRIMEVEPELKCNLVDNGNIISQKYVPEDVRALPAKYERVSPLITHVKVNNGKNQDVLKNDVFAVKPLYKDADRTWVVEAIPAPKEEMTLGRLEKEKAEHVKEEFHFPDFLPANQFTVVSIVYKDDASTTEDTYFVGTAATMSCLLEMCQTFEKSSVNCEKIPATLGALGITKYEGEWYRAKVVSVSPFKVLYIDYGNVDTGNPDDFRKCPESHREVKPLVQKVELAPGTSAKYFNLPQNSQLNIQPVATIGDAVIVKVKGENYDDEAITKFMKEMSRSVLEASTEVQATAVSVKQEPLSPAPAATVSKLQPPQSAMAAPSPQANTYPDIFCQEGFTNVEIVLKVEDSSDSYYVGAENVVEEIAKLMRDITNLAPTCETITPKVGDIAIADFENAWYRVKVVSTSPLKVFYMDYGNTEEAESVKKLPDQFLGVKPLVYKIKLAPGTSEKYFNLVDSSKVKVAPIALIDDTVIVKVMGETYDDDVLPKLIAEMKKSVLETSTELQATATAVSVKQEPLSPAPAATVSKPQPPQSAIAAPSPQANTYPDIFCQEGFTNVEILFKGDDLSEICDSYYVGAENVMLKVVAMVNEISKLAPACEIITPEVGELAIAYFDGSWYRVRVLSKSPLRVFYIDYGNTEDAESVRELPNEFLDVKPLAYKIKLAPGTSQKYMNLDDFSHLKVKPVAKLDDGTVIVHVEGETYEKSNKTSGVAFSTESLPSASVATVSSARTTPKNKPTYVIEMLDEGWDVEFVPQRLSEGKLFGSVYSTKLPETKNFIIDDTISTVMETAKFDPSYIPKVGDLVACKRGMDWIRGKVLVDKVCTVVDHALAIRTDLVKQLDKQFVNIPYLGAVFTPHSESTHLLCELNDKVLLKFTVLEVDNSNGQVSVKVEGKLDDNDVQGTLHSWDFNCLAESYPLVDKDAVVITSVVDSNTVMVAPDPTNDFFFYQAIQEACNESNEVFSSAPKVGDYVAFVKNQYFFRSKVTNIHPEIEEYELFQIDFGSTDKAKLSSLKPLPRALYKLAKRTTQVELKGVEKIPRVGMNEICERVFKHVIAEKMSFTIKFDGSIQSGIVTLTAALGNENFNEKIQDLIKPKPDLSGKLTLMSMPTYQPPLKTKLTMVVSLEDPLTMGVCELLMKFITEVQEDMGVYFSTERPYNPSVGELCLVCWEDYIYRALCLKETNAKFSQVMLIDYGNVVGIPTNDIRKMDADFLMMPQLGLRCKIQGNESEVAAIHPKLTLNSAHSVIVERVDDKDNLIITFPDFKL